MVIIPFAILFLITIVLSILWARGIEKNKNVKGDDIEFP